MFFKSRLALLFISLLNWALFGSSIIAADTQKVISFLNCWMLNGRHRRGGKSPVTLPRQVRESAPGQDVDYALVLLPQRAKASYRLLACGAQKSACT